MPPRAGGGTPALLRLCPFVLPSQQEVRPGVRGILGYLRRIHGLQHRQRPCLCQWRQASFSPGKQKPWACHFKNAVRKKWVCSLLLLLLPPAAFPNEHRRQWAGVEEAKCYAAVLLNYIRCYQHPAPTLEQKKANRGKWKYLPHPILILI